MPPEETKANRPLLIRRLSYVPVKWAFGSTEDLELGDQDSVVEDLLNEFCAPFYLSDRTLREIMDRLEDSMVEGLEGKPDAVVRMLPSFVRSVPNGTETGTYLALDLGGTNFRVLLIKLNGKDAETDGNIHRIPQEIMLGTGEQLFDHIADCLAKSMEEAGLKEEIAMPLGFTFSFPVSQEGLTRGRLVTWTKGFKASGVENEDVVALLKEAIHKRNDLGVEVVALLNDTTGTLMSCAHQDNQCAVGVIVGTGTNACYIENLPNCPKLDGQMEEGPDEIIINTEWGAFGDDGRLDIIRTKYDRLLDANSLNPGKQIFEKMMSGMYMGELVRLVFEKMNNEGQLFDGEPSPELATRGSFPTKFISEIEKDVLEDDLQMNTTFSIFEEMGVPFISPADCLHAARVCAAVSRRAAYLCAAAIAAVLNRMQRPFVTIGFDGSVFRFHPTFEKNLQKKLEDLVDPGIEFKLVLSEDGSGKGAALVAAVACRVREEQELQQRRKRFQYQRQHVRSDLDFDTTQVSI